MLSSNIVETLLLLAFVYLILSLMTSVILGYLQGLFRLRANFLEIGIKSMLRDAYLTEAIFKHPLIKALETSSNRKPSYIPADVFSAALFDILEREALQSQSASTKKQAKKGKFDVIYDYVDGMMDKPETRVLLLTVLNESTRSITKARLELEELYINVADRISGIYKERAKLQGMIVAIVLALILNADTISIARFAFVNNFMGEFPVGWTPANLPSSAYEWLQKVLGILLTALAAASIFPVWYDLPRLIFQRSKSKQQREVNATIEMLQNARTDDVQVVAAQQIKLLDDYHKIVLDQSRKSFGSALVAAIVGLGFFLGAVISILSSQKIDVALISAVAGSLVEVISGVNFYLYAKTTAQMADFQSRLDMTQRFLLANSICETLEGEFKQKTRSQLVLEIANPKEVKVDTQPDAKAKT